MKLINKMFVCGLLMSVVVAIPCLYAMDGQQDKEGERGFHSEEGDEGRSADTFDNRLLWAAQCGNVKKVAQLLREGADVNAKGPGGVTPLMCAAVKGRTQVVELLLMSKAVVDQMTDEGDTALLGALQMISCDEAKLPLVSALAKRRHHEVVRLLIEGEADVNRVQGELSSYVLLKAIRLEDEALVKTVLDGSADVDRADDKGVTPLRAAVYEKRAEIMELLLKNKATVDLRAGAGDITPLHYACLGGWVKGARVLLEHSADIEVKAARVNNSTPLLLAIISKNAELVQLLIDKKADASIVICEGKLGAVKTAVEGGQTAIVKMLMEAGADYGDMDEDGKLTWDRAKPKLRKVVVTSKKDRIQKLVGGQDWLPEELLSMSFLEDIVPLKQIVCDYAHMCSLDQEENQIMAEQIAHNKKKHKRGMWSFF